MNVLAQTRFLEPFGLEVIVPPDTPWEALDVAQVHAWVAEHRVLVLRGLRRLEMAQLPLAARRLGPLQAWSFGAVNELKLDAGQKNYLYTDRAVPLHWDGAFASRVPRYLFFQCLSTSEAAGGETLFVDTTRVWARADERTRDRWRALRFRYETQRVVHYGGRFSANMVALHPYTGEAVLRFAEPVDDLNPVSVRAEGLDPLSSAAMVTELREALQQPSAMLAHRWEPGDVVIADNHALLHGRRPFPGGARRHLRRVNVHGPERSWRDTLRDSLRIRRLEFLVAELPILLVPALLLVSAPGELASALFAKAAALFFLLFHFGDMTNCLADRELDAVYKTHLSEAVYGLGVRNVVVQILLTAAAALGLAAHLAFTLGRWELVGLVAFGLLLGAQYSTGPLRLKGQGVWQVVALWAVIFFGPMLLIVLTLSSTLPIPLLVLIACYGVMQQGIILINTAEDLPEDEAAGIRTTAVALGLGGCVRLAVAMVAMGGLGVAGGLGWMAGRTGVSPVEVLSPLVVAWGWVLWSVASTWPLVRGRARDAAVAALRLRARWMPVWISATAWATLFAAARTGAGWLVSR